MGVVFGGKLSVVFSGLIVVSVCVMVVVLGVVLLGNMNRLIVNG